MGPFHDVQEALEHLVRQEQLPFTWYTLDPRDDHLVLSVSTLDEPAAVEFFIGHPVWLVDGTQVEVHIITSAAWSWQTEPLGRPASDPDPAALEGLVGTDVQTAALTANASGWIVRAMEPEAMVTADLRTNRVNLSYSPADGTVTRVDRG